MYKLTYSIQLDKTGGGTSVADMWIAINGTAVPDSASRCVVVGQNGETFPFCEYLIPMSAGQYVEVYFFSPDATMAATSFVAAPPIPAVPSIITNVVQIA